VISSRRIAELRHRSGLSEGAVAEQLGINEKAYWDIEHYDDDMDTTISVKQLSQLAIILNVSVAELLGTEDYKNTVSSADVSTLLRQAITRYGGNLIDFEDDLGWKVSHVLEHPDALYDLNVDGFRAICLAAGINWRHALPERPPASTKGTGVALA
jgi:transcriptional regulator with XRE-family HTH domain